MIIFRNNMNGPSREAAMERLTPEKSPAGRSGETGEIRYNRRESDTFLFWHVLSFSARFAETVGGRQI